MTKQELIKKVGNEEQAEYTMEILLKSVTSSFVNMAIRAELKSINEQIKEMEDEGFIYENGGTKFVNWSKEYEPLNGGSYWNATEEQISECETMVKRLQDAEALIYKMHRTESLIAVR